MIESDNSEKTDKERSTAATEKLLAEAHADFKTAKDYYDEEYANGEEDAEFLQGDPWPENIRKMREAQGSPCLHIPRLAPFVHQVENEQRQNNLAIKVSPVDDHGDKETARILRGIIRNIETTSGASIAYNRAGHNQLRRGIGWIRITTAYADERSFDQDIQILEVFDPGSCYIDPNHKNQDGSDAEYGFVSEMVDRAVFEAQYPGKDPVSFKEFGSVDGDWCTEDKVRVAEYFKKEWKDTTLYQLLDGNTCTAEEAKEQGIDVAGLKSRKTRIPTIKWYKLTAADILEETVWPGKYIPLVPVYGDLIWHEGRRIARSLIHDAKDSQRLLNYWKSVHAETIALQPKAPYIGAVGQFKTNREKWLNANVTNAAFLEYDLVDHKGQLAPAPQRQAPPTASIAMFQEAMAAGEDIKNALGMFEASLGQQGDEKSGKAILARQQQGNNATFHFMDNRAVAIRQVGRIIIDLIPKIYVGARVVRIIGEDGQEETVRTITGAGKPANQNEGIYALDMGKYDVVADVGPAYATKRIESVNTIIELIRAQPQMAGIVGDILFKNLDFAEADDIAERLKAQLPPELRGDDPTAMQLQQAAKAIEALKAQIAQMDQALKDKSQSEQLDREVKLKELDIRSKEVDNKAVEAQAKLMPPAPVMPAADPAAANPIQLPPGVTMEAIIQAVIALEGQVEDASNALNMILSHEGGEEGTAAPEQAAA
ncbi:portal protein [Methylobacterium sp. 1030]|uniref:portal protein n=1 Tax=Methylobacterium sp. 1030 TaxID=3156404 RepID=UPI00339267E7